MVMPLPTYYTADMVRAFSEDGNRYEVVHGELLVSPAPRKWHQELTSRLNTALTAYLEREPFGHVFLSPADISWGDDTLVQPDLFVVPLEDARTLEWEGMRRLLLAIEVLSPSSVRADRFTKRRVYQEQGLLYWIVDGDAREVEVWTPGSHFPTVEREAVTWRPTGVSEPFGMELEQLFRPI